jgi:hypothetical protein
VVLGGCKALTLSNMFLHSAATFWSSLYLFRGIASLRLKTPRERKPEEYRRKGCEADCQDLVVLVSTHCLVKGFFTE